MSVKSISIIFFITILQITILKVFAQKDEKEKFKDLPLSERIFYGGNFGLSFGTVTYIEIAPLIGYRLTPAIDAGITPKYIYYNDKYYKLNANIFGGSIFSRITLFKDMGEVLPVDNNSKLFLHGEYETLNINTNLLNVNSPANREWFNSLWLGGGLSYPIGIKGKVNVLVLYDILHINHPFYTNPQVRIGFEF